MIGKFAFRYFIAKKSTNAINIISWVSISAIAVGAAALIIVLSVFNGFEGLVKSLYSSFYPELKIAPDIGKTMLVPAEKLQALKQLDNVKAVGGIIRQKAILRYNNQQTIAIVQGVDDEFKNISGLPQYILRGKYAIGDSSTPACVIGLGIEAALNVDVRESVYPITVYIPKRNIGSFLLPEAALNSGALNPRGTFAIQQEFDNQYIITNIDFMRHLLQLPKNAFSAVEISLKDISKMEETQRQIQQLMGNKVKVLNRYQQNSSLYNIMTTEKWAVYIILSFILIIAAFNMIGSLSMLVIEKQKDITILKSLGLRNSLIRRIFLSEGLLIAGVGTAIGFSLALIICWLQLHYHLVMLQGGTFVIDYYPVSLHLSDFLLVFFTILIIALLASWFPAARAARQPIELKAQ